MASRARDMLEGVDIKWVPAYTDGESFEARLNDRADQMAKYTQNYQGAGGTGTFSDYYHAKYDCAKIDDSLKEKVTYASHNLVTDGVFGEMNLILCRNVFIYFNRELQNKVLKLFLESLCRGGYLCLGNSESLRFSESEEAFKEISQDERIYQENQLQVNQV